MAYYRRNKPTPQQEVKLEFATGSGMIFLGACGAVIDIILIIEIVSSLNRGDTKNVISCGVLLFVAGVITGCLPMGIRAIKEGVDLKRKLNNQRIDHQNDIDQY